MTNALITAMQTDDALTENGMPAHSTSGAKIVDLFYQMGAMRAKDQSTVQTLYAEAFGENPLLATKAAFYHRDIRGGQGERRSFGTMFGWLCEHEPATATANIPNVPFFGRFDDLFAAIGTPIETAAMDFYAQALLAGDKLAAKWAPRAKTAKSATQVRALRLALGRAAGKGALPLKSYRKLLAGNTDVVESKMSRKEWAAINYSHVPSLAISRYRKAFAKRDTERYTAWVTELAKPVEERAEGVKVNAGAIYPYNIVRVIKDWSQAMVSKQALEAQWAALPNYMTGSESARILPILDVSGSMDDDGSPSAMDVCVSLGLYLAERNVGAFKDTFITFSAAPQVFEIKATSLRDRVAEVEAADWGGNTDLEAVFRLMLGHAQRHNVPTSEMPTMLLILSDMQFDDCVENGSDNALAMIDRMYAAAGYMRPNIVFWNLRASTGVPVKVSQGGTALVSGFSPSIMTSVLAVEDMTPAAMVTKTLLAERYERVVLG